MIFEKVLKFLDITVIDKKKIATVTVLFPGSFKPMHGGHVNLIKTYAKHPYVNCVKVLIGPGVRNGVTQEVAYQIANLLLENIDNVDVEMVKEVSPVLTCYKYMEKAEEGVYALAGTNKGEDYKRVTKFVNDFKPQGKYRYTLSEDVEVTEIDIKTEPQTYLWRNDEHNHDAISGRVLRRDVLNKDENQFWTSYPGVDRHTVEKIWRLIEPIIVESGAVLNIILKLLLFP
jgi:hypothetical protein